jgi:hypothetical protein
MSHPYALAETLELTGALKDQRKLIAFSCGCCRLIYDRLPNIAQRALAVAEAYVRGESSSKDLLDEGVKLWEFLGKDSCDFSSQRVNAVRAVICCLFDNTPPNEAYDHVRTVMEFCNAVEVHEVEQSALLTEIFQ